MGLLDSIILFIAFVFLLFIFWPGALLVVAVWLWLHFIRKPASVAKEKK